MKILQRYVLQELGVPFLLCFATLNFIFMAGYLVKAASLIIGRGIPLLDTIFVLILALPEMVSYTAPTSILTAILIVFGGLSQNNEIRAMKASGVHPFLIMTPALLVGLVLSLAMFLFNDQVTTNAGFQLRKTTKKMILKHPSAAIEPGRFVKLSESIVFRARYLEGNKMRDIVAYENEGGVKPVRTIIAETGEIMSPDGGASVEIRLYDGSISDAEQASVKSIQFKTYEFPSFGQEDIRLMRKKMRDRTLAELLLQAQEPELSKGDRVEISSAFHQRISFAFGSLIFVLVGIPIAMLVQRGEIVLSFAVSMAAASLYYILFVGAKTLAIRTDIPAIIAYWLPNLLLFGLGIYLLRKAIAK